MSFSTEFRDLANILDKKTSSDAQNLIRSLLNAFPDDLNLTGEDQVLNDPTNNMDFDQQSGLLTPIRNNQSSTSTPSLSLPDSFDVDCFDLAKQSKGKAVVEKAPGRFPIHPLPPSGSCARCVETDHVHSAEKAQLTSKCAETKASLDVALQKYDAVHAELSRLQKISSINEENQRLEIAALTDRCVRLTNLHESESALHRKYEEKAHKFDAADAELQKHRKEVAELRAVMEQQGKAVQILTQSENAARKASDDAERSKELLAMDKAYLQQEVRTLEGRYNDKTRAAEASHSQCLALEVKVAQLTDQLLTLQLTARSGFDERMDKEIQRLREENAREMEGLKATSRDILDRENRVLREAKASVENECHQLRLRNDTLSQQLSLVQQEMVNAQQDKNNTISDLRAELKMKSFELTTLGVTFEERVSQLRQVEAEVEVMRLEISAHKSALQRLEAENHQATHDLRSELVQCTTRLRAYEALEEEIDGAVMRTAGLYGGQHSSAGDAAALLESTEAAAAKLLHSVKGIPTNPERRVKQAVYLAQRLLEAERQRDAMQTELKKAKADLAAAQKQAEIAAENLTRAAQPTAYLVNKLRDEENAKTTFLGKCKTLEEETQRSRQAELASRREAQQLRERLQSLLQQRGELETVKLMLAQLSALEAEDEDTDSSDESSDGSEDGSRAGRRVGFSGAAAEEQKRNSLSPTSSSRSSQHSQRSGGRSKSPVAMAAPSTPSKVPGASLSSTAAALGLTPEQVKEMTSPPKR